MQTRTFGRTDLEVSVIGFGAAPVAYLKSDQDRAADVISQLLDAGVNLIDTAASYPGSEEFLGERFSSRRDEFILVSKCGQKIEEVDARPWSAELIAATVDRALKKLRTDHLDVMLLHSCSLDELKKGDAIGALVKAREAGKIRHAGYSGDNEAAAYTAGLSDIAVIETSINIADQRNIDLVLPIARKQSVGVIVKRPIANAAWRGADGLPGMYKSYASTYVDRLKKMEITPESVGFKSVDAENAWTEMALRFTLGMDGVHTAIIGTTNPQNAIKNVEFANAGDLPSAVTQAIRDAFADADADQKWIGQT